ncbi:MAG: hypothetical protein Q4F05_13940 [bacterium]|nr:hypothetical protein [bacterium]
MKKKVTKLILLASAVLGAIVILLGGYRFKEAQTIIVTNKNYTWTPPFTDYENKIFLKKWSGLGCIVIGAIVLIVVTICFIYIKKHARVRKVGQKADIVKGCTANVQESNIQDNIHNIRNNEADCIENSRMNTPAELFHIENEANEKKRTANPRFQPELYVYSEEENLKFARPKN